MTTASSTDGSFSSRSPFSSIPTSQKTTDTTGAITSQQVSNTDGGLSSQTGTHISSVHSTTPDNGNSSSTIDLNLSTTVNGSTISEMTSTPTTPSSLDTSTPSSPGDATTATPPTPGDSTITATPDYSTTSVVPPTPSPICIGKADGNYTVGKCSTKYTTCLNGIASYQVINCHNCEDLPFKFGKFPLLKFRCVL